MSQLAIRIPMIPTDWTMNTSGLHHRYLELTWPGHGYVTVDWIDRTYRLGLATSGRPATTATYAGRGWSQRLVDDAVRALRAAVGNQGE